MAEHLAREAGAIVRNDDGYVIRRPDRFEARGGDHAAVGVLISSPDGLLVFERARPPAGIAPVAGHVDQHGGPEQAARIEVAEEVGVTVSEPRYFASQSWPFPHSLMVAFTVRWTGGEIVPQPDEIEDARWFPLDALPDIPPPFSIAGQLIRDTIARMHAGGGRLG